MTKSGNPRHGRIFISYRREDSQWVAGRLGDSLAAYFGDDRVFRDIEGISGGADFAEEIQRSLDTADAVIVLIGRGWLDARDEGGNRRLDDPQDWVSQEVDLALASSVPVYPVLIDDTPMPRTDELPELLQPLARFHAVSVSDARWEADINALAKIVALDIPSATARLLQSINLLLSTALFLAIAFTVTVVLWNLLHNAPSLGDWLQTEWQFSHLYTQNDDGSCCHPPWFRLLSLGMSGVIFTVIAPASAILFVVGRHIDASRRWYFYGAAWLGGLGTFAAFIAFNPVCDEYEPVVLFFAGMLLAPLMLALMSLSGFRSR